LPAERSIAGEALSFPAMQEDAAAKIAALLK